MLLDWQVLKIMLVPVLAYLLGAMLISALECQKDMPEV